MSVPNWLTEVRDSIWEWALTLRDPAHPGMFVWCREGATVRPSKQTGLGASCLALKLAYQVKALERVDRVDLGRWIDHIQSFQRRPDKRYGGFFQDRGLMRAVNRKYLWLRKDVATLRAETRQACAALMCGGCTPKYPVTDLPRTPAAVTEFLELLAWENPWAAGSHASHLMFFLKLNATRFGMTDEFERLGPRVLEKLDSLQDPETGVWFRGSPPVLNMINGAMKVLTLYEVIQQPFRWPERVIDFCLTSANDGDACNNADVMYVLHECARWTDHRKDEIRAAARAKLETVREHAKPDGGFSFFPDASGRTYYGARSSAGHPVSDIHGSVLLVWTCTLIANLLGFSDELGWRLPIT